MIRDKRILAVIPARGGSLGVPRKNVKSLAGRPLIAHSIETALAVDGFDRVVVSTDDAEIKSVAEGMGCAVVERPGELTGPEASTESALLHALEVLQAAGESFDYVATLEPTSPLRTAATVRACLDALIERGGKSLLAVRQTSQVLGTVEDGLFRLLSPDARRRRQDRDPLYAEAGTLYACTVDHLRQTGSVVAEDWLAYVVPEREALDINTLDDFAYAEFLCRHGEIEP